MLDPVLGLKFHTPINTIFKCISPSQSSSPNILLANPTVFSDRREALQHCDLKERNVCYSDDQNIFLIDTRSLSMGPAHSSWNPWYFLWWEQHVCLCYVNKAAFGKPSGHLRCGLVAWKTNPVLRGSELSVQTPCSQLNFCRGERHWRRSSIANGQWLN